MSGDEADVLVRWDAGAAFYRRMARVSRKHLSLIVDTRSTPMLRPPSTIRFRRLDTLATPPRYATLGSAGADLYALTFATLRPGERTKVGTGIAVEIPEGWVGLVTPRSGTAVKHGITLPNSPAVIDSDYRGELLVPLVNHDPSNTWEVREGDRIAQLLIVPAPQVEFLEVDELTTTHRGAGGFGSTGGFR